MKFNSFQEITWNTRNLNELAYLIGALRDGNFTERKINYIYRVRIYQKNLEWIKRLTKIFKKLFNKIPVLTFDRRNEVWELKIDSKEIYSKLVNLCNYPGKQSLWTTPTWILNSSSKIQISYVKGFFDSEGGIPHVEERIVKPKDIRIYFSQANKQSLEELKSMINNFDIKTGKILGPYYKKGYKIPQFAFIIHGISNVIKFYQIFGSLHPEKIKRFMIIKNMKE